MSCLRCHTEAVCCHMSMPTHLVAAMVYDRSGSVVLSRWLLLSPCVLLSSHVHLNLQTANVTMSCWQGGGEKLTDEAIEDTLEKVVKLLAYISDKDLFAEFYRKKLARRLLHDRSSSDEHERSILSRLKQQCGAQFTSKVILPALLCSVTSKQHMRWTQHSKQSCLCMHTVLTAASNMQVRPMAAQARSCRLQLGNYHSNA